MSEVPVILLRIDREAGKHTRHPRHLHPALDLKYIQAELAAGLGHLPPLLDGWETNFDSESFAARALALQPRIAVIRAVTWCLEESVRVAVKLRTAGIITIAVGQQVNHVMNAGHPGWQEAYDLAVVGEPEQAAPHLIRQLMAGTPLEELRRESRRKMAAREMELVATPDGLHAPRFEQDELTRYPFPFPTGGRPISRWGYVLGSWGCPRPCRHCSLIVRKSAGQPLRKRSPASIADEVARLLEQGAQAISFEDDSLLVDRHHFLALCDVIIRRRLDFRWLANARPDELDAESVAAAAAAGAALIKVGVDSGSPALIERIGKSRDGIGWLRDSAEGAARLRRAGIESLGLFMVGLPGETEADVEASLALARRMAPDYIQVQIFCPYPDIPLWPELGDKSGAALYHYGEQTASPSNLPAQKLAAFQRDFYRRFYFRPAFALGHLQRHWRSYLDMASLRAAYAALAYLAHR